MSTPTWEQFAAIFAPADDIETQHTRDALIQEYVELAECEPASDISYLNALVYVHGGGCFDAEDGTLMFAESLYDALEGEVSAKFNWDSSTVNLSFGGNSLVLTEHRLGTIPFEQDLALMEQLLQGQYYLVRRVSGQTSEDGEDYLWVSADHWYRAESQFGASAVAAQFQRQVSNELTFAAPGNAMSASSELSASFGGEFDREIAKATASGHAPSGQTVDGGRSAGSTRRLVAWLTGLALGAVAVVYVVSKN